MKILLADASNAFREELQERLSDVPSAIVVGTTVSEEQTVLVTALSRPDVLLIAPQLADGTGCAALERLRSAGFQGTAYAMVAGGNGVCGADCTGSGVDAFYDKGQDLDRLVDTISALAQDPHSVVAGTIELPRTRQARCSCPQR